MPLLSKEDLKYTYAWTGASPDDPRLRRSPDRKELDREKGYDVLAFINAMAEVNGVTRKETGLKIERLIRDHLPRDIRLRESVTDWIMTNWSRH